MDERFLFKPRIGALAHRIIEIRKRTLAAAAEDDMTAFARSNEEADRVIRSLTPNEFGEVKVVMEKLLKQRQPSSK